MLRKNIKRKFFFFIRVSRQQILRSATGSGFADTKHGNDFCLLQAVPLSVNTVYEKWVLGEFCCYLAVYAMEVANTCEYF